MGNKLVKKKMKKEKRKSSENFCLYEEHGVRKIFHGSEIHGYDLEPRVPQVVFPVNADDLRSGCEISEQ